MTVLQGVCFALVNAHSSIMENSKAAEKMLQVYEEICIP